MQKLTSNHKKYYQFGQHCDIDEAAIAWSGNHSCKFYNKDKPDPFHFKAFVVNCGLTL